VLDVAHEHFYKILFRILPRKTIKIRLFLTKLFKEYHTIVGWRFLDHRVEVEIAEMTFSSRLLNCSI